MRKRQNQRSSCFLIYSFIGLACFASAYVYHWLIFLSAFPVGIYSRDTLYLFSDVKLLMVQHKALTVLFYFLEKVFLSLQTVIKPCLICQNESPQYDEIGCKQTQSTFETTVCILSTLCCMNSNPAELREPKGRLSRQRPPIISPVHLSSSSSHPCHFNNAPVRAESMEKHLCMKKSQAQSII